MNNSDFIAKFLSSNGYNTAFGVTGGGAMFLNEAFRKNKKINFIFTHHEQSAAMAAEAYCRIKKKPAVLSITSGPGGTNAITGVIGAWIDSVPMIIISGQVESKDMILKSGTRQIGIQEANIYEIIKPITKYAKVLKTSSDIEKELKTAVIISKQGRPGPVWLDIPLDVQSQKFSKKKINFKINETFSNNKSLKKKDKKKILRVHKLIKNSKRPLVLIGNGIHLGDAEKEFLRFLKISQLPFLSSWNASDIVDSNHKLNFGRPGLFGNRISNFAIQSCDLLIILGCRLSVPITGYQIKNFSPNSKKIYVDIDQKEILKRNLKIKLKLNFDVKIFLRFFNSYIKNKKLSLKLSWIKKLEKLKLDLDEDKKYLNQKNFINSFNFINELSKTLNGNENIVTDMGTSFTCTMQAFKTKKNQRLFTSSGIAAMGFGLPGLLGSYFADKKKIPICITGDGGLMFNIQELQTIKNYKIPAKIFIINNGGYLTMKLMQKKNFKKFVGADDQSGLTLPNFSKIAKAFGFSFKKITNAKNIKQDLIKIFKSKQALICEVMIPTLQDLVPRVQTQMNKDGSFEPAMIDNMYPFIEKTYLHTIRKKLMKN
jgi:acetolactate synthase-1/2/3 large subunit